MSVIIAAFTQSSASNSQKPGVAARNIQINSIRKEQDPADPNAALFEGEGSIFVQLHGISAAVAEQLPAGSKIKVTLEVIADPKTP